MPAQSLTLFHQLNRNKHDARVFHAFDHRERVFFTNIVFVFG